MSEKHYRIKSVCPQCGCSAAAVMTEDEIRQQYGDVPNIHMTCSECTKQYDASMADACPEWDTECKMAKK